MERIDPDRGKICELIAKQKPYFNLPIKNLRSPEDALGKAREDLREKYGKYAWRSARYSVNIAALSLDAIYGYTQMPDKTMGLLGIQPTLRAALEASAIADWLMAGGTSDWDSVTKRGISHKWNSFEERRKAADAHGILSSSRGSRKEKRRMFKSAIQAGNTLQPRGKPNAPARIRPMPGSIELLQIANNRKGGLLTPNREATYRYLSAFIHSNPWIAATQASPDIELLFCLTGIVSLSVACTLNEWSLHNGIADIPSCPAECLLHR